jgi:hypothetical protein
MLVCARTKHKAVDGSSDVVSIAVRNPFSVDVSRAIQPRNTVVLLGDDAIKA